jgi:hypothetical protein
MGKGFNTIFLGVVTKVSPTVFRENAAKNQLSGPPSGTGFS